MAAATPEVAATGLNYPEGALLLPDGSVAFVETAHARVSALLPDGSLEVLTITGGGPNGLALGSDGYVYVAQNGIPMGDVPFAPACVQRFKPGGLTEVVATRAGDVVCAGPNDLAFGPDGRLYVTDPARDRSAGVPGRLLAFSQDRGEVMVEQWDAYINGVGFDIEDNLVWAESYAFRLWRRRSSGDERFSQLPDGHMPDGFALANDGRIFVASVLSHGISVVGPDGAVLDLIELDADATPSNCCFQDSVLWVTDYTQPDPATLGRLWRIETDAVGQPLHQGTLAPHPGLL